MEEISISRKNCVCFSGHRKLNQEDEIGIKLSATLRVALDEGFKSFYCGMAEGFDLLAAEEFLRIRVNYPRTELIAVVPHRGQERRFSPENRERYYAVLEQAEDVIVLNDTFRAGCYHQRNDFMLDHSSRLICYYDGSSGGTRYTVARALKQGLSVLNLHQTDEQQRLF